MKLYYYTYIIADCIGEGYLADCFGKCIGLGVIEDNKIYEELYILNCTAEDYLTDETITDWVEL